MMVEYTATANITVGKKSNRCHLVSFVVRFNLHEPAGMLLHVVHQLFRSLPSVQLGALQGYAEWIDERLSTKTIRLSTQFQKREGFRVMLHKVDRRRARF